MKVPFVDLPAGILPHKHEYLAAIEEVLTSAYFSGGPVVEGFEKDFAAATGARHAIAVANGTDALVLMLRGAGVGPGDEVILPSNSFFATAEAVSHAGATPVPVDVLDDTLLIDPAAVEARIGPRTRAVIAVHLFGQLADMDALASLCQARGIELFEDSAQAHGARRGDQLAGSIGRAAGFSFYPTKNLGAFGEGGAVTTNDDAVAAAVRSLRDHGQNGRHNHELVGYNARLDAMQCACLRIRLRHLAGFNAARQRLAARYRAGLADVPGVRLVAELPGERPVYHLFVVRVAADRRDAIMKSLGAAGVATAIHYPTPIHRQPAYAALGLGEGSLPVAEAAAREMISLPMYPELGDEAVDHVVRSLVHAVA